MPILSRNIPYGLANDLDIGIENFVTGAAVKQCLCPPGLHNFLHYTSIS